MSTTTTDRAQDLPPTFDPDQWVPPPHAVPGYRVSAFIRAGGHRQLPGTVRPSDQRS